MSKFESLVKKANVFSKGIKSSEATVTKAIQYSQEKELKEIIAEFQAKKISVANVAESLRNVQPMDRLFK